MLSKDMILINLHAMSEVFNEFVNSDTTFKECCMLYNVNNIGEMLSSAFFTILINNFCIAKDVNFELTINDNYNQIDYSYVTILNGRNYSKKQIIKEIRDGLSHLSYEISDDYSFVHINNKRTGFEANIDPYFLGQSKFFGIVASNYNSFMLDDRLIDFKNGFDKNISNIKVYRLRAKNKNDDPNSEHFKGKSYTSKVKEFLDETKYDRISCQLDEMQLNLLREYFQKHEFTKDSLSFALGAISYNEAGFGNNQNNFIIDFLFDLSKSLNKCDVKFTDIIQSAPNSDRKNMSYNQGINKETLETLNNYFKILFITEYYKYLSIQSEESTHIRNCLCHGRYTKLPVQSIILCDHPNGIMRESTISYKRMFSIDELYYQTEIMAFDYDRKKIM